MALLLVTCQALVAAEPAKPLKRYEFQRIRMGVPWSLQFYTDSDDRALQAAERAFERVKQLDRVLSDYDPDSELNRLCHQSTPGAAVQVSDDLFRVLAFSQKLSRQTGGAFDVTVGPITDLWRRAWRKRSLPDRGLLNTALQRVGSTKVDLCETEQTVTLAVADMQLDLGAIAKGYAADAALKVLHAEGITRVLVDASGDISLGDPPPDREHWIVSIAPLKKTAGEPLAADSLVHLQLAGGAVATSGDANRYLEIDGIRYSHIVNPATGMGLTTSSSVTVIAENGMIADALASALSVLPAEEGLKLLEKYRAEALLVIAEPDGLRTVHSCGWARYLHDTAAGDE